MHTDKSTTSNPHNSGDMCITVRIMQLLNSLAISGSGSVLIDFSSTEGPVKANTTPGESGIGCDGLTTPSGRGPLGRSISDATARV